MSEIEELLARIQELLGASTVKYYTCVDRKTLHKKIVIEHGHESNDE